MHCEACAVSINMLLTNKAGVERVHVNFERGTAEIEYDDEEISLEDIADVISDMGYHVKEENGEEE